MKNHRFPWLRNRTTDNRKCEKARNIKEKRTIEMFNTDSRRREERASSPSVNFRATKEIVFRLSQRFKTLAIAGVFLLWKLKKNAGI